MTVYTEDDGTEIDEDTFSAFDPGSSGKRKLKVFWLLSPWGGGFGVTFMPYSLGI